MRSALFIHAEKHDDEGLKMRISKIHPSGFFRILQVNPINMRLFSLINLSVFIHIELGKYVHQVIDGIVFRFLHRIICGEACILIFPKLYYTQATNF